MEDLANEFFWDFKDIFYDDAGNAYPVTPYNSGELFNPGGLNPSQDKNPDWCVMLVDGLGYVGKGGKQKEEGTTSVTHINYLEVPVIATYYKRIGTENAFHVGAGPWIAYALGGKFKTSDQNSIAIKFGKNGDFTRMDYGAGLRAGFIFSKRWDATLGCDMGLNNLLGTQGAPPDGDKGHTRNFSLSLGVWLK